MDYLKQTAKKILQWQAKRVLQKYNPKIVGIIGAVGKTVTKETIYTVLSKKVFVRKSEKSFTTEVGVPLTILGHAYGTNTLLEWLQCIFSGLNLILFKKTYPEWLVLELDSDKPGDLEGVSSWVKPDILVVTAIGTVPSHIESFGDIENFVREKSFMVDAVKREGVIIYNSDDVLVENLVKDSEVRKVSCGTNPLANIKGGELEMLLGGKDSSVLTGMKFNIIYRKKEYSVSRLECVGIHIEYASLLAFAVGHEFHFSSKDIVTSLNKVKPLQGRSRIIQGIKNSVLVDDTYNASPLATREFVGLLGKINTNTRKVLILGDMLELGKYSAVEHRSLAVLVKQNANFVVTVGFRMRKLVDELLNEGFDESLIISFDSVEEANKTMDSLIQEGDVVLVKGSQAMRMEKLVEEVMRHPEDAKKVLVRQEEEWMSR
ncbi:MAG: UDP-N-acetylmuramoyl-tripeptide--D-alanyl-D-alanine ligase [Patescibacteria group bacterium]